VLQEVNRKEGILIRVNTGKDTVEAKSLKARNLYLVWKNFQRLISEFF